MQNQGTPTTTKHTHTCSSCWRGATCLALVLGWLQASKGWVGAGHGHNGAVASQELAVDVELGEGWEVKEDLEASTHVGLGEDVEGGEGDAGLGQQLCDLTAVFALGVRWCALHKEHDTRCAEETRRGSVLVRARLLLLLLRDSAHCVLDECLQSGGECCIHSLQSWW